MKLIEFISPNDETMRLVSGFSRNSLPYPSTHLIPKWFKDTPKFLPNEPKVDRSGDPNTTVRNCMPFQDLMGAGYHIPLPCDVWIERNDNGNVSVRWALDKLLLFVPHDTIRNKLMPVEVGYEPILFKVINPWIIKTPSNYSCIFQSPYGHDLPFHSVGSLVDTDKHPAQVNIPIMLKKGFSGLIEKGTPFVQVIPFKREEWTSNIKIDDGTMQSKWDYAHTYFFDRYRRFFRSKKVFKCPFHR
jgi:hypothetical protein